MTEQEIALRTIQSALVECDRHLERLTKAMKLLDNQFPLNAQRLDGLNDSQVSYMDQFIYRFTKLQDSLGTRLLPALYSVLENTDEPIPFLDVLHQLEKLGVLSSAQDWQYFRNIRNGLAHEYPESAEQTISTLNALYAEWPRFERLYSAVKAYLEKRPELA